ncbi:MAG: hypothetical protein WC608_00285 [Parcubacteria group bacterium]
MQHKNIIQYILIAISITISFFAFWSVERAVRIPEASDWLAPIIWFSWLFIFLGLNIALITDKKIVFPFLFTSLLVSLIFSLSPWHFLVILFGFLLLLAARMRIRGDIEYGKKIKLWRSLRFGKSYIYLSLALVISSQYYFLVKDEPAQRFLPDFKVDSLTEYLTPKILSAVSPELSASVDGEMTVDDFILQMQKSQLDQAGYSPEKLAKLPPEQRVEIQKQIDAEIGDNQGKALEESRKKFAELVGRPVDGSEKVSDIFSEIINGKVNSYLKPGSINTEGLPIVPVITLVLFLTIWSLGSFLGIFLVPVAAVIFWILVQAKLVLISKVQAEVEIIE